MKRTHYWPGVLFVERLLARSTEPLMGCPRRALETSIPPEAALEQSARRAMKAHRAWPPRDAVPHQVRFTPARRYPQARRRSGSAKAEMVDVARSSGE